MRERGKRRNNSAKSGPGELLRLLLTVAVISWLFRSLLFAPFNIPSASMLPNMLIGDYVVVAKWPYGYSRYSFPWQIPSFDGRMFGSLPKRGDVVVFRGPQGNDVVKRAIGLPGDTIEVREGQLILNGQPLRRAPARTFVSEVSANTPCRKITEAGVSMAPPTGQCSYSALRETLPGGRSYTVLDQVSGPADNFGPITVPADRLFVMGDNRDDSLDSRFEPFEGGMGLVPLENVIGRAVTLFWSTDGSASYPKPWTWFTALRGDRIGSGFDEEPK